jgi:hypothetical protein
MPSKNGTMKTAVRKYHERSQRELLSRADVSCHESSTVILSLSSIYHFEYTQIIL